jgi:predicted RNA-binding protein with PUA-like domain
VARAIDRDSLGAWLLKANPALWDISGFLQAGEDRISSWAVQPGYRSRLMTPGDRVLFWVSGDGSSGLARGIWGDGQVVAPAEDWVDAESRHWRDDQARAAVRARVRVNITFLDEPVTAEELRARGLTDLEVLRIPQGANPSWVSRAQLAVLEELLSSG